MTYDELLLTYNRCKDYYWIPYHQAPIWMIHNPERCVVETDRHSYSYDATAYETGTEDIEEFISDFQPYSIMAYISEPKYGDEVISVFEIDILLEYHPGYIQDGDNGYLSYKLRRGIKESELVQKRLQDMLFPEGLRIDALKEALHAMG